MVNVRMDRRFGLCALEFLGRVRCICDDRLLRVTERERGASGVFQEGLDRFFFVLWVMYIHYRACLVAGRYVPLCSHCLKLCTERTEYIMEAPANNIYKHNGTTDGIGHATFIRYLLPPLLESRIWQPITPGQQISSVHTWTKIKLTTCRAR
jgi:hypothetical protein